MFVFPVLLTVLHISDSDMQKFDIQCPALKCSMPTLTG